MNSITKQYLTVQCGLYKDIISVITDISNNIIIKPHPTAKIIKDWYKQSIFEVDYPLCQFLSRGIYDRYEFPDTDYDTDESQ